MLLEVQLRAKSAPRTQLVPVPLLMVFRRRAVALLVRTGQGLQKVYLPLQALATLAQLVLLPYRLEP